MGLLPLEFSECYTDSPYFRDNIHTHEAELERTSQAIKQLIKESKTLLQAARMPDQGLHRSCDRTSETLLPVMRGRGRSTFNSPAARMSPRKKSSPYRPRYVSSANLARQYHKKCRQFVTDVCTNPLS